jgi:hypothetical protein
MSSKEMTRGENMSVVQRQVAAITEYLRENVWSKNVTSPAQNTPSEESRKTPLPNLSAQNYSPTSAPE